MGRRDRSCICCGARYQYCPTCSNDRMKPTWMTEFCGEDCKELWTVATKFNMQMLTKEEAQEAISILELKDRSVYVECVQRDLENILAEEKVEEPVVVEEVPAEATYKYKKKQKHEVVTETIE